MGMIFRYTLLVFFLAVALKPDILRAHHFQDLSGDPQLRSASAIVIDDTGALVYAKDESAVRPIASITKLMTAIVVLDSGLDLEEKIEITKDDRDLVKLTGSRLKYGASLSRKDMILLAVMSSENRAAAALGRTFEGGTAALIRRMNEKAVALGMKDTRFVDPVGLNPENVSTAKDLAILVTTAREYPLIVEASTTRRLDVHPYHDRGPLAYGNTNRLLGKPTWDIKVSKTGYINEAGRCLVMQAVVEGEALSIIFLDSFGSLTPYGDSNRLRKWLLGGGSSR